MHGCAHLGKPSRETVACTSNSCRGEQKNVTAGEAGQPLRFERASETAAECSARSTRDLRRTDRLPRFLTTTSRPFRTSSPQRPHVTYRAGRRSSLAASLVQCFCRHHLVRREIRVPPIRGGLGVSGKNR